MRVQKISAISAPETLLERRRFLKTLLESSALAAGALAVGCGKSPSSPPAGPSVVPPVATSRSVQFYSGSSLDESGRSIEVTGFLDIAADAASAIVAVIFDGQRREVGRLAVSPTTGGWLHEFADTEQRMLAQYVRPTNELQAMLQSERIHPTFVLAAVVTAMAIGALMGMVSSVIEYSVLHVKNWNFKDALDAAWKGALFGAVLGPVASEAEVYLKPVVGRFVQALGQETNYTAALNLAWRFFSDMVEAIKRLF